MGEISWLSSFKTVGGIKSGPVALCGFKLASNFWMPGVDIVISGIEWWGLGPLSGRGPGVSFVKTDSSAMRLFYLSIYNMRHFACVSL